MTDKSDKPDSSEAPITPETLSRRRFLRQAVIGTALVGAATAVGGPAVAADLDVDDIRYRRHSGVSKYYADYQWHPNRGEHCSGCEHFLDPDRCEIVRGHISPRGWCRFYEYDEDEDNRGDRY
jgi:hypothetical protein